MRKIFRKLYQSQPTVCFSLHALLNSYLFNNDVFNNEKQCREKTSGKCSSEGGHTWAGRWRIHGSGLTAPPCTLRVTAHSSTLVANWPWSERWWPSHCFWKESSPIPNVKDKFYFFFFLMKTNYKHIQNRKISTSYMNTQYSRKTPGHIFL